MANQPNIIFIFPDQHRGAALGINNPAVITPNLDKLAAESVVFGQCHTNSPLCMPARASMMSGQYVSKHGCWNNNFGSDADPHGPSHVRSIRDAGYHTAVIGKDHLVHFPRDIKPEDRRQWYKNALETGWGFDEPITTHTRQSLVNAYPKMPPRGEPSYPQILEAHGLMQKQREYMATYFEKCHRGEIMPWDEPPNPLPVEYQLDSYIGQRAVQWLNDYAGAKPFYLQVNFSGPHDPFDSPQSFRDKYRRENMPVGKLMKPAEPVAPYVRYVSNWGNIKEMTPEQYKQGCINYYASITLIDEQVGKIIAAMRAKGLADNTWIIYNSDHGEMLGDHYLRHKIVFYDESVLVPCIIRPPRGTKGWRSEALVETIDMSATMLDIAGGTMQEGTPGVSLRQKVLAGPASAGAQKGKNYVFSEVIGYAMVRSARYKLAVALNEKLAAMISAGDVTPQDPAAQVPVEMYDLQNDPNEYRNVVNQPEYQNARAELMRVLKQHLAENLDRERLMKVLATPNDGRFGMS